MPTISVQHCSTGFLAGPRGRPSPVPLTNARRVCRLQPQPTPMGPSGQSTSEPPPYALPSLDPETARTLATHGGTLLILDMPPGTVFGLDTMAFLVGPRFRGVKMIPPNGVHYVMARAISGRPDAPAAPPQAQGFFLHLAPKQVVVRRWDPGAEQLVEVDDEEAERYAHGVERHDFDAGLAPYNLLGTATWAALSSCITPELAARLQQPGSGFGYTALPPRLVDAAVGASPAERTARNMDKSALLRRVLREVGGWAGLCGELQHAFITFIQAHSPEGYTQWKGLLTLALSSPDAALADADGTAGFVRILDTVRAQLDVTVGCDTPQLAGIPAEPAAAAGLAGILDELLPDSFLRHAFGGFFAALQEEARAVGQQRMDEALVGAATRLQRTLAARLGWEYGSGSDADDDGPTIVADPEHFISL